MKNDALVWLAGIAISASFHLGLSTFLEISVDPDPVEMQDVPEARLEMTAYEVKRSEVREDEIEGEQAKPGDTEQTALSQDAIPRVTAIPQNPQSIQTPATLLTPDSLPPASNPSDIALTASAPQIPAIGSFKPVTSAVAAAKPPATRITGGKVFSEPVMRPQNPLSDRVEITAPNVATLVSTGQVFSGPAMQPQIPSSDKVAITAPNVAKLVSAQPSSTTLGSAPPQAVLVADDNIFGNRVADSRLAQTSVASAPTTAPLLVASLSPGWRPSARQPTATILSDVQPPEGDDLASLRPDARPSPPVDTQGASLKSGGLPSAIATPSPTPSRPARETAPGELAQDLPPQPPPSEFATASLAWIGGSKASFDPASLAAIQSFMTESDLSDAGNNAGSVRDGIAAMLSQVPCARLQVAFVPETGSLELRGHVPEEGLRVPVLAALQAQMGGSIPVVDNLLILPRPQCGALAGIGSVGLPQSTDQLTNPLIVGADAHARSYSYSQGERLTFDLSAPDYDAYVYVDYFDADGMVIHLVPNQTVTLEHQIAKTEIAIGNDRTDGNFLAVTIGPPYGQEIAAAFATSVPLYQGVRPTVEPADAYLDWLREKVSRARQANTDFKGEWVYFFISTSPGG